MGEPHVVSALRDKRAEISGMITDRDSTASSLFGHQMSSATQLATIMLALL